SGIVGSLSRRRSEAACRSVHRSIELIQQHLLAAEDSPRVRQAIADHWRRLAYELYPDAPELSRDAERRSASFGGSSVPPPFGRRPHPLARLFGRRLFRRFALRNRS